MAKDKQESWIKKYGKIALKLSISVFGLWFVSRKIDFEQVWQTVKHINLLYFLAAVAAFHVSKIIASFRTLEFYKAMDIRLSIPDNLRLLYIGMFYNLFLPGSVGGDGYKVYLLKQNSEAGTKRLIAATLLDRLSGLSLLLILACALLLGTPVVDEIPFGAALAIVIIVATIPGFYMVMRLLFYKQFSKKILSTSFLSLLVQLGQLGCASLVLLSLGVQEEFYSYLTLFMVSSVVAVVPITVGGVGVRELVMIYGFGYLPIDKELAVAFTLMFFVALALTSLTGLFFAFGKDEFDTSHKRT